MNKRALIVVGAILLFPVTIVLFWAFQGNRMEEDLAESLRTGAAESVHRDLLGKRWSREELATIVVLKVPAGAGRERGLVRTLHSRGRVFVSSNLYDYQGEVRDDTTGIVHVFGCPRSEPRLWRWVQIHPDSLHLQLQRQTKQLEEMKSNAASRQ